LRNHRKYVRIRRLIDNRNDFISTYRKKEATNLKDISRSDLEKDPCEDDRFEFLDFKIRLRSKRASEQSIRNSLSLGKRCFFSLIIARNVNDIKIMKIVKIECSFTLFNDKKNKPNGRILDSRGSATRANSWILLIHSKNSMDKALMRNISRLSCNNKIGR